jgi:transcriptional antiterminator RfaH
VPEKPHSEPLILGDASDSVAWFCLRTHPKHEHIAAAHLRRHEQIEVLNPRVRFWRATRAGRILVTEALFPNYLFARFDWRNSLNRIHYAPGIGGVVHFGDRWPTIPPEAIEELRRIVGAEEVHEIDDEVKPGEEVEIAGGAFHGLKAVVSQVMPGSRRVVVLLDFLGRQSAVQVPSASIVRSGFRR